MNLEQLILLKLAEECNEVGQECSKIMQFGMDEVYEPIGISNRERLKRELQDLFSIVQILNEDFDLGFEHSKEHVQIKRAKFMHYAQYSKSLGKLKVGPGEVSVINSLDRKVKDSRDECVATGEDCVYQLELIPSEFLTGQEGGQLTPIVQCKHCGKVKED